jgi:xanthine/CO dehydrogenase XdhC/CoxF family maturation factor
VTADRVDGTLGDSKLNAGAADIGRALLDAGESSLHELGGRDLFVDVLRPPPRLVIVSGGDDARPLAAFGAAIGFRLVIVDRRPGLLAEERFPRAADRVVATPDDLTRRVALGRDAYAVVMSHSYADDREYLRALLATDVPYIGVLGPRQRTERILAELGGGALDDERVYGPIGLDIGTDGAEQVALSALSEILSVRSGRRPTSLRERVHPIHVDARR